MTIVPLVCISMALAATAAESSLTADQALKALMDGNARFVTGEGRLIPTSPRSASLN